MIRRFISLLLFIGVLPVSIFIAVLIRLDSRGSVIFKQERLGLHQKPFTLYKFRTMIKGAEDTSGPVWAQLNDPRVTRIGRFLRKTRLDEIPQLINVLKGDMNFIGCRPARLHFANQLKKKVAHYERRFEIKPGLTGWAQVHEPYANTVDAQMRKLEYEIYYVDNRNFILDFKILFMTLLIPFKNMGV